MGAHRKYFANPGDRFERWMVVAEVERGHVLCRCECGTERRVLVKGLCTGSSRSCGCLKDDMTRERNRETKRKHGLGRSPIYHCWNQMMRRCHNPAADDYPNYGGRGITVHRPWHDAAVFAREIVAEIGPLPRGLTLDRINNEDGYRPGNVRWANRTEQARNRRNTWESRRANEGAPLAQPAPRRRTKLSNSAIADILRLSARGVSQVEIAEQVGICQPHVSRIIREAREAAR